MATTHRALVVLKLSFHVPDLSKQGHAIVLAMTNNDWFPSSPTLPTLSAALTMLDLLEANARNGKAAIEARNAQKRVVVRLLQQEAARVQGIADANVDQAAAVIVSAGMRVKKVTPRQKNTLRVRQGDVSGLVLLMAALAGAKAGYLWQWSVDQAVWTDHPQVFKTTISVSGLIPATRYYFRYKSITPAGMSDWSQIVSLLVT